MDENPDNQFASAETFDQWFEKNQGLILAMSRSNEYELLYQAWFGGYQTGLNEMADFSKNLCQRYNV